MNVFQGKKTTSSNTILCNVKVYYNLSISFIVRNCLNIDFFLNKENIDLQQLTYYLVKLKLLQQLPLI